ncbi:MAG: N-acetylmuramoyl-L-alanine amidase [Bacilli bacterium]|nr:N-acetylmuramoyl-L-alanine amidase [Bacilli bacterium]
MKRVVSILFILILSLILIGCKEELNKEVNQINDFVSNLPEEVTIDLESDIDSMITLYNNLSAEEKEEVTNYNKLLEAKEVIIDLHNEEAALIIVNLINDLDEEVTLSDEDKYLNIKEKLDEATAEVLAKITNKTSFDNKYTQYLELKSGPSDEDKNKALAVDTLILNLPEETTLEDKEAIEAARSEYTALTNDQKELVTKLSILEEKEAELVVLEEQANNKSELELQIEALPDIITLDQEIEILDIKNKIELLSTNELDLIKNYDKYLNSFYQYQELKINEYIELSIPDYLIDEYSFPDKDPYFGISLEYTPLDTNLLSDGWVWHQASEEETFILVKYNINNVVKEKQVKAIVLSEKYAYSALDFIGQFKQPLARSYENISLVSVSYPDAVISFDSLNKDIFSNEGTLVRPTKDLSVTLKISVKFPEEELKTFEVGIKVKGLLMSEIAILLEEEFTKSLGNNGLVTTDLNLPVYDEFYNVNIYWESGDTGIMSNDGLFSNPGMDNIPFSLKARIVRADDESKEANLEFVLLAKGQPYEDQWEAAQHLLQMVNLEEVNNQKFTMLGVTNYVAYNFGYIPFFTNTRSNITEGMIPLSNTNRPGNIRPGTKYITIHDTANAREGADAEMHYRYVTNPETTNASWHYSVDDGAIYQHLPNDEVGWHAGNTITDLFSGNQYSVGIETCINEGVDYNQVMRNTAKLTAELLKNYNLTINDIKQHYDFSTKDCPRNMRHYNRWNEFLNLVKIEYFALYNLEGVNFTWESLNPSVLDHTGKVINHPGPDTRVNYKVTVEISGEQRIYEYSTLLKGLTF